MKPRLNRVCAKRCWLRSVDASLSSPELPPATAFYDQCVPRSRPWGDVAAWVAENELRTVRTLYPSIWRKLQYFSHFELAADVVATYGVGTTAGVRELYDGWRGGFFSPAIIAGAIARDGGAFCLISSWRMSPAAIEEFRHDQAAHHARYTRWQNRIDVAAGLPNPQTDRLQYAP